MPIEDVSKVFDKGMTSYFRIIFYPSDKGCYMVYTSIQNERAVTSISNIAFVAVLVIIAYCGAWNSVEGRYLPTRGDETRREQMKEVLKVLLDLAPDGREYGAPAEFAGYGRHQAIEKRSVAQPEQVIVPEDSHDSLHQTAAAPSH